MALRYVTSDSDSGSEPDTYGEIVDVEWLNAMQDEYRAQCEDKGYEARLRYVLGEMGGCPEARDPKVWEYDKTIRSHKKGHFRCACGHDIEELKIVKTTDADGVQYEALLGNHCIERTFEKAEVLKMKKDVKERKEKADVKKYLDKLPWDIEICPDCGHKRLTSKKGNLYCPCYFNKDTCTKYINSKGTISFRKDCQGCGGILRISETKHLYKTVHKHCWKMLRNTTMIPPT